MNYFRPYSLSADETIISAWDSQVAQAAETPWLAEALATQSTELFPCFATFYAELRALPRGARRAVQRQLARSREVAMPSAWQHKLAHSLAGAALLLALAQGAHAATIKVTTSKPEINDGDRKCSLSEAIVNANHDAAIFGDCAAGSGADTIVLPKQRTFTLSNYDYYYRDNYTGLPLITSKITIQGNGATIIRQARRHDKYFYDPPEFRLIKVDSSGDLTLRHITLSGGYLYDTSGGGISNAGTLSIENSRISGNYAGRAGGGIVNFGTLTIDHSTVSGNTALDSGGGIYNRGGILTVKNSTISGNTARFDSGGGIYNYDGTLTIENSTISGNAAYYGGGGIVTITDEYTTVTIENSTISGNTAVYDGGGVLSLSDLTIKNSTISENTAGNGGGGINNYYGTLTIENSTIFGNTAAGDGGGIFNYYGTLTIENSTISGNTAVSGGGVYSGGGGFNYYSILIIENSTISGNTAVSGGGLFTNPNYQNYYNYLALNRSLISGNNAVTGPEILNEGSATADNFNLFGSNGSSGVTGFTPGPSDIVPASGVTLNKIIGPLKNNGGPTKTHALVGGSPAVNAVPLADPGCTGTDQRGKPRPHGPGCDIGAFEK